MYADQPGSAPGQTVIVEDKPGAGALVGIDTLAMSPADGQTLLMTTSGTVWQKRVLYVRRPCGLDKDFVAVADQLNRSEGSKIRSIHYRGESPR
jgi:tripartite-type tricarboxylate transporter receptor subunit TctC